MNMIFDSYSTNSLACPKCHQGGGADFKPDHDIECSQCNITYRRSMLKTSETELKSQNLLQSIDSDARARQSTPPKQLRPLDDGDEVALFRHVRIRIPNFEAEYANHKVLAESGFFNCCFQIVERYSMCRCLYYKHDLHHRPNCHCSDTPNHKVPERTILVGYACEFHFKSQEDHVGKVKKL